MFDQFHDDWNAQTKICLDHMSAKVSVYIFMQKAQHTQIHSHKNQTNRHIKKTKTTTYICTDNVVSM